MLGVGALLKEYCEQAPGGRITSEELADRLQKAGYKFSSSFLRGVMTGKNLASYRLLKGCEKVFNLANGELTRFAVGYFAHQLAERHDLSIHQVARLLKEYLRGGESISSRHGKPSITPTEVGEGSTEITGEKGVRHRRTIRSIMYPLGVCKAPILLSSTVCG